jgi:hypothetical protein
VRTDAGGLSSPTSTHLLCPHDIGIGFGFGVGVAIGIAIAIAIEIAVGIDPFVPTVRYVHDHTHANVPET